MIASVIITVALAGCTPSAPETALVPNDRAEPPASQGTIATPPSASVPAAEAGEMKVGHFSITLEDVSLPLAGIPITVTRTYDSRRAHERLDFGYGWTVDYANVRVHESRRVGFGWSLQEYRQGFFANWCVLPNGEHIWWRGQWSYGSARGFCNCGYRRGRGCSRPSLRARSAYSCRAQPREGRT